MIITTIILVLFSIWIIRNVLYWTWLWQVKEYRLDRLLVHLKETNQGRQLLFSKLSLLKWIGILGYGLVIYNENLLIIFQLFVLGIYTVQALEVFKEIKGRIYKRPKFTTKSLIVIFSTLLFTLSLILIPLIQEDLWTLLVDRVMILFEAFLVFFLSFPTEIFFDIEIARAAKKIREHKKVLVIGVTGSYGKTSTKEYIAAILSKRFKVLRTKGTNNTKIGVTKTILKGLKKETQIFVVEMGAYKKGEIQELCQIANPKIGVLTAVSPQHVSLFGNFQNVMETKYELIQALPKNGIALFNGNNKNAYDLYQQTTMQKVLYKIVTGKSGDKADIKATHVIVTKQGISFTVAKGRKELKFKSSLIGIHNIENILPAIYLGFYLGVPDEDIVTAVSELRPLPQTMVKRKLLNGTIAIDSTFNSNPQSFSTVFDYMKLYKGKKILVMSPMIELGKHAKLEHYKVGYNAASVCDYIFLTNDNFKKDIEKGVSDNPRKTILKIGNPKEIAKLIQEKTAKLSDENIVVFLGKETGLSLRRLI